MACANNYKRAIANKRAEVNMSVNTEFSEPKVEANYLVSADERDNKEVERQRIQSEVEQFLAGGGTIHAIDKNVVADPPKKPQSSYGSQPI
ncbi:MAG: hypothetical protein ACI93R_001312 [Flavobacteriales bacterium]